MAIERVRDTSWIRWVMWGTFAAAMLLNSTRAAHAAPAEKPKPRPLQVTLQRESQDGFIEEVNLILNPDDTSAVMARNSNFAGDTENFRFELGKFSTNRDSTIRLRASALRLAAKRLSRTQPRTAKLLQRFKNAAAGESHRHIARYLIDGVETDMDFEPWSPLLKTAFNEIIDESNWKREDAVTVEFQRRTETARITGSKRTRTPASVKCEDRGITLSGKQKWRCEIPGYGRTQFTALPSLPQNPSPSKKESGSGSRANE